MILLDTHVLIWWVREEKQRLSRVAEALIEQENLTGDILISAMTFWEVSLLHSLGRLDFETDVRTWFKTVLRFPRVQTVDVNPSIAMEANELPGGLHRDPADRILVATARSLGVVLVTADQKIRGYPHVKTIW